MRGCSRAPPGTTSCFGPRVANPGRNSVAFRSALRYCSPCVHARKLLRVPVWVTRGCSFRTCRAALGCSRCCRVYGSPNSLLLTWPARSLLRARKAMDTMAGQMLVNRMFAAREIVPIEASLFPVARVMIELERGRERHVQAVLRPWVRQPMHETEVPFRNFLMQIASCTKMDRLETVPPVPHLNHIDSRLGRENCLRHRLWRAEFPSAKARKPVPGLMHKQERCGPCNSTSHHAEVQSAHFAVSPRSSIGTATSRTATLLINCCYYRLLELMVAPLDRSL